MIKKLGERFVYINSVYTGYSVVAHNWIGAWPSTDGAC